MANIIKDHQSGTTWKGMSLVWKMADENGIEQPVNLTGASIIAEFRIKDNVPTFSFKTEDNTITIPNPLTGKFFFMSRIMDINPATYNYDIFATLSDGTVKCLFSDCWNITKNAPNR